MRGDGKGLMASKGDHKGLPGQKGRGRDIGRGRMRFARTKMGEGAIYWKGRQCHLGATTRVALTNWVWVVRW